MFERDYRKFWKALLKRRKEARESLPPAAPAFPVLPAAEPIFIREELIISAKKRLVEPTPENLHWAYEHEVSIRAITKLIIESINGAGWVFSGDQKAVEFIKSFFDPASPKFKVDLEDFIETSVTNLVICGNQLWRFIVRNKKFEGLAPIDWRTITPYRHPFTGWRVWLQGAMGKTIYVPTRLPMEKEIWDRLPGKDIESLFMEKTALVEPIKLTPEDVIYLSIDSRGREQGESPLVPVLTIIVYKKLLEWIMSRTAELWGMPIFIGKTGLKELPPQTPEDIRELAKRVKDFADQLVKFREFGIFSLPFDQEIEVVFPGTGLFDYTKVLDYFSKQIVLSILGSTALFEAKGVELATSRTIKSVWDEALDGWRRRLKRVIDAQIIRRLLDLYNVEGKCEIIFLRREWTEEEIKARLRLIEK